MVIGVRNIKVYSCTRRSIIGLCRSSINYHPGLRTKTATDKYVNNGCLHSII